MNEYAIRMVLKMRDEFSAQLAKLAGSVQATMTKVNASFAQNSGLNKFQHEIDQTQRKIKGLEGDLAVLSRFRATPEVKLETAKAKAELKVLQAELAVATRDRDINIDIDTKAAAANVRKLRGEFEQMSQVGGTFGRIIAMILIVLGPLASALISVGAAAISMASSLGAAAVALGGIGAAAIGQAIPAIGLLILQFQRLGKVMDAIKAQETATKAARTDTTASINAQRQAAQNLVRAQEGVKDAERNLATARRQAKRDLEDLIITQRKARLEQENAALSSIDAQRAVRRSVQSGDSVVDIRRAQLGRTGAADDATLAARNAQRTIVDTNREIGRGVEQNRAVIQATRALRDASWQLADAQRAVADAAKGSASANQAAADALAELTPAEKRLMQQIVALKGEWKTISSPLMSVITDTFAQVVHGIRDLIKDPDIQAAIGNFSKAIASGIKIFFDAISAPENRRNLKELSKQAMDTFPLIAKAAGNIFTWFQKIAVAAGPMFKRLLEDFTGWTDNINKGADDRERLERFFDKMEDHLRSWGRLVKAVIDLFKALFDVSGDAGMGLVDSLTGAINTLTDYINNNRDSVKSFFDESADAVRAMGDVLVELGKAFAANFDAELIK
jgi:hypothetical protein